MWQECGGGRQALRASLEPLGISTQLPFALYRNSSRSSVAAGSQESQGFQAVRSALAQFAAVDVYLTISLPLEVPVSGPLLAGSPVITSIATSQPLRLPSLLLVLMHAALVPLSYLVSVFWACVKECFPLCVFPQLWADGLRVNPRVASLSIRVIMPT